MARADAAAVRHAGAAKKIRSAMKAKIVAGAETLLSLSRGLRTFNIKFQDFKRTFEKDPLHMTREELDAIDLMQQRTVVLMSDREGAQTLGYVMFLF